MPQSSTANASPTRAAITFTYAELASLQAAYMPFIQNGGLFFPTTTTYTMQATITMHITLPDGDPADAITGTVVWQTPDTAMDERAAGVGVAFTGRAGRVMKERIEAMLSDEPAVSPLW